ncbi:MAG: large subunit ribosomal protein L21 [Candidatus Berkelbacteria bacterium Licking1014_2]|uniref:Large ribosomal subunit protein bL21 n=1 Tax=Candidatus Berkelbacteria bacterium Licking1014_2 TaxID=2017146 RepID=A0A554LW19_9BACT|nr:MAG: large subunit ribosomal protein L21 [Candidatus Berkelbacteria bacterium Licking1014_2]
MPKVKKEKKAVQEKKPQDIGVAIIAVGGKQHKVVVNQIIKTEKLTAKPGEKIDLTDLLTNAKVTAEVIATELGEKLTAVKFRRRKGYLKRIGHRQWQTALKIISIKK